MNLYITWSLVGRTIFFAPVIRKSMIKYLDIFSPLAGSKVETREWLTEKSGGILRPQGTKYVYLKL